MERTYKKIEIVGVSEASFAEATQNAVATAWSVTTPCRLVRSDGNARAG
jgi:flavin-binding protein dodecin